MSAVDDFENALDRRNLDFNKHKKDDGCIIFQIFAHLPGDIPTCMYFLFKADDSVTYSVLNIAKLEEYYKLDELRNLICHINSTYRWARFGIDDNNTVFAMSEHYVTDEYDMSDLIFENGLQFFSVVQQVHPKLMQLVWK